MAKDAKGHGSEARGAVEARLAAARNNPNHPLGVLSRIVSQGTPILGQDAAAANDLAAGHPKSATVPVHGGAAGRVTILHHPDYGEYKVPNGGSGYYTNDKADAEGTARAIHGPKVSITHRSKRYE